MIDLRLVVKIHQIEFSIPFYFIQIIELTAILIEQKSEEQSASFTLTEALLEQLYAPIDKSVANLR